jgi:hypothetical protein
MLHVQVLFNRIGRYSDSRYGDTELILRTTEFLRPMADFVIFIYVDTAAVGRTAKFGRVGQAISLDEPSFWRDKLRPVCAPFHNSGLVAEAKSSSTISFLTCLRKVRSVLFAELDGRNGVPHAKKYRSTGGESKYPCDCAVV